MSRSPGVRRLSLFLGSIGAVLWLLLLGSWAVLLGRQVLAYYLLGALVCFLIPFLLVEGIAWVIRGFGVER